MSLESPTDSQERVSKVTFSRASDACDDNDLLVVNIRSVAPQEEDVARMETIRRSASADGKKRSRISRSFSESKSTPIHKSRPIHKSTMTDAPPEGEAVPQSSGPCLKHAAKNISRKANRMPSEKVSLCNDCSKSMLSYIFLVQDFLESLATEICGKEGSEGCPQCLREESRPTASSTAASSVSKTRAQDKAAAARSQPDGSSQSKSEGRNARKYEETSEQHIQRTLLQLQEKVSPLPIGTGKYGTEHSEIQHRNDSENPASSNVPQGDFHGQSPRAHQGDPRISHQPERHSHQTETRNHQSELFSPQGHQGDVGTHPESSGHGLRTTDDQQPNLPQPNSNLGDELPSQQPQEPHSHGRGSSRQEPHTHGGGSSRQEPHTHGGGSSRQEPHTHGGGSSRQEPHTHGGGSSRQEPHTHGGGSSRQEPPAFSERASDSVGFHSVEDASTPFGDELDHLLTTLSKSDREVYDAARNNAGWDTLSESQDERLVSAATVPSEAYVTFARNNAEAIGCLVVGTSLLLTRTSRTLCVLLSEGVSNAFRGPLSSVFHVVQCVRSMDSLGTTKLALLEQPELGISFDKLNVWRLTQFNKCVFLNPDTLVVQNCDELFGREELSAVADVGWPDCFNSGMFVFVPALKTFWSLVEFAEKQGSYDGGDQGLLNSYFTSWSTDVVKKLSFIYNLMANVSYTYTPAFRQFGRNVKIVQFHGTFKPWHVKFYTRTGQISPSTAVHPTYVQFVHVWINIFRISALRQLSKEMQTYATSEEVICAVELLRFFPLPTESEAEFFLTPPSVRLRLAERKMHVIPKRSADEAAYRRKSAEFPRNFVRDDNKVFDGGEKVTFKEAAHEEVAETAEGEPEEVAADADAKVDETTLKKSLLPGSEIGDYQGMKAWEQGRMDYQGADSSENVLKRLEFLMSQPN